MVCFIYTQSTGRPTRTAAINLIKYTLHGQIDVYTT